MISEALSAVTKAHDIACISHDAGSLGSENALSCGNACESDWVSINRGEVIDVEHLTGRHGSR
jgi:hypothetical protein